MRTIAIINQKGGSGKTTSAINLGAVLARRGHRTLLVDMDPQGHCGLGLAVPENHIDCQIGDALLAPASHPLDRERFLWRVSKTLHLAPSNVRLAGVEAAKGGLAAREDRDTRLTDVLMNVLPDYDWCLVDCPPFIGLLTYNALRAASEVLVPVETGFFAMQGASKQIATLKALCKRFGGSTPFTILPTMHEEDSALARDVLKELKRRFGDNVAPVVIRRDPKLRECVSMGVPIIEYDAACNGSKDYSSLAAWFVDRGPHPQPQIADPAQSDTPALESTPESQRVGNDPMSRVATSRAAELAAKARSMSLRTAEREATRHTPAPSPSTGPLHEIKPPPQSQPPQPRIFGVQQTSQGLLFVQPGGPHHMIFVAGDHNEWSPTTSPLQYNPSLGMHEAIIPVNPGMFRYRLVVNGQWTIDPYNPRTEPNPFGGMNNVFDVVAPRRAEVVSDDSRVEAANIGG